SCGPTFQTPGSPQAVPAITEGVVQYRNIVPLLQVRGLACGRGRLTEHRCARGRYASFDGSLSCVPIAVADWINPVTIAIAMYLGSTPGSAAPTRQLCGGVFAV